MSKHDALEEGDRFVPDENHAHIESESSSDESSDDGEVVFLDEGDRLSYHADTGSDTECDSADEDEMNLFNELSVGGRDRGGEVGRGGVRAARGLGEGRID